MGRSFTKWLDHTCTIEEFSTTRSSIGGVTKTWSNKETAVVCRLIDQSQALASESEGEQVLYTHKLLLKSNAVIDIHDRISNVRTSSGALIDNGPFQIEQVLNRRKKATRHITLLLQRIN